MNPETYPSWAQITFEFPASASDMPPVKFTWYEGHKDKDKKVKVLPPEDLVKIMDEIREKTKSRTAAAARCWSATRASSISPDDYGASYFLLPEDKFKDYKKPEPTAAAQRQGRRRHEGRVGRGHPAAARRPSRTSTTPPC